MKRHECQESRRIASLATLESADRSHLSGCEPCREYLLVHRALSDLAANDAATHRMPAADVVFVRSLILEKRRIAHEIAKPMKIFQGIANTILVVSWLAFAAIQWSPFLNWISGLELSPATGIESSGALPLSFFWMFAVLSVMTMMTMLHGLWTEEHAV